MSFSLSVDTFVNPLHFLSTIDNRASYRQSTRSGRAMSRTQQVCECSPALFTRHCSWSTIWCDASRLMPPPLPAPSRPTGAPPARRYNGRSSGALDERGRGGRPSERLPTSDGYSSVRAEPPPPAPLTPRHHEHQRPTTALWALPPSPSSLSGAYPPLVKVGKLSHQDFEP